MAETIDENSPFYLLWCYPAGVFQSFDVDGNSLGLKHESSHCVIDAPATQAMFAITGHDRERKYSAVYPVMDRLFLNSGFKLDEQHGFTELRFDDEWTFDIHEEHSVLLT